MFYSLNDEFRLNLEKGGLCFSLYFHVFVFVVGYGPGKQQRESNFSLWQDVVNISAH